MSNLSLRPRPSSDRGHANPGWLNSYHSFSFADYYDADHHNFGPLRVINEDRVVGGRGFGKHPHRDQEIYSYIVSGALRHDDSLGNTETLRRGDVQFTSTGSGISHSEMNGDKSEVVHFLQLWVTPAKRGLPPVYQTKHFDDAEKLAKLRLIVSPDGADQSITINQDVRTYATLLPAGQSVSLPILPGRGAYVHVVMDVVSFDKERRETGVELDGTRLLDGDGCYVELQDKSKPGKLTLTGYSSSSKPAELLVFDVPL
jgi:hypothetical protein